MKFENKGKWLKESAGSDLTDDEELTFAEESDESDDLFGDELDLVDDEQPMNEVRYIDPKNLDRYDPDEIEEVTDASGNKRYKRSNNPGVGRNAQEQPKEQPKEEPEKETEQDAADRRYTNDWRLQNIMFNKFSNRSTQIKLKEDPEDFVKAFAKELGRIKGLSPEKIKTKALIELEDIVSPEQAEQVSDAIAKEYKVQGFDTAKQDLQELASGLPQLKGGGYPLAGIELSSAVRDVSDRDLQDSFNARMALQNVQSSKNYVDSFRRQSFITKKEAEKFYAKLDENEKILQDALDKLNQGNS